LFKELKHTAGEIMLKYGYLSSFEETDPIFADSQGFFNNSYGYFKLE
jgi:hypothetical protein